jgi:hypothetical protein
MSGRLVGVGSLLIQEMLDGKPLQANMSVPIDLLGPILDDMLKTGRSGRPSRPWLGMYTTEAENQFVVAGVADGGPADAAGVRPRDAVIAVAGQRPVARGRPAPGAGALGRPQRLPEEAPVALSAPARAPQAATGLMPPPRARYSRKPAIARLPRFHMIPFRKATR